jgi:rhamnosyltransferase subunit B
VTIASTPFYRAKVEELGIGFRAMRPDWNPTDSELIRQCEDMKRGPEILLRKLVLPYLRDTYEDLLAAVADADLMVAGEMVFPAPLIAEKLGLRWGSVILSPCSFLSAYDPSVLANLQWFYGLRRAGWLVNRAMLDCGRLTVRHWWDPVRELRRELGLRVECDPLFRDKFSPDLVLALFSRWLAEPQMDWPESVVQPGFVFYDRLRVGDSAADSAAELRDFLAAGDAPVVFTLGSTAVHNAGDFYEVGAAAARRLGRRAVLLGAPDGLGSAEILTLPYAPYSEIFPHAAAVVHQGGSGTTGQAMRAGRPMLIVPYGWDQPDNAARVERLGVGLWLPRSDYSAETAAGALGRLVGDSRFAERAAEVGAKVRGEDGLGLACDAVERLL